MEKGIGPANIIMDIGGIAPIRTAAALGSRGEDETRGLSLSEIPGAGEHGAVKDHPVIDVVAVTAQRTVRNAFDVMAAFFTQ